MIDKKIANICSFPLEPRQGGPSTYLYNLRKGIMDMGLENVCQFWYKKTPNGLNEKNLNTINFKSKAFLKNFAIKCLSLSPSVLGHVARYYVEEKILKSIQEHFIGIESIEKSHITKYHFHNTIDFYLGYNFVPNTAIKILTSHSPEPYHLEFEYNCQFAFKNYKFCAALKNYIKKIDIFSFSKADYILFPAEESLESYIESWPEFVELIKDKHFIFVPSGSPPLISSTAPEQIRKIFRIPLNAFVVSYIGRHNHVKGYDILQKAAIEVWKNNPDIYFLIAGKEAPLKGLKNEKWIEAGWTDDPGSIINASDIFILPNRKTFFDLVLIEVLSLGKPIIASNTGGNKFVAKQSSGIKSFENGNVKELSNIILDMSINRNLLFSLGKENKKLFENFYTCKHFAERYINSLNNIN